jgi:hypothetical protein
MRIEMQHCLPQTNAPCLQQFFVDHASASLPPQHGMNQPFVSTYQTVQTDWTPRLGADESDWPIQVEWVYNRHKTPPLGWDLILLDYLI